MDDAYLAAGQMLRDYRGGGDMCAEIHRRAQADPQVRAMLAELRAAVKRAAEAIAAEQERRSQPR
jgi:hypothetical protein